MPQNTQAQMKMALQITTAVLETIREAKRVPSGTIYAAVMGKMDFEAYTKMIDLIVRTGLVKQISHELVWAGPLGVVR